MELEAFHPGGLAQPAHGPVHQQPEHGQRANGPQHDGRHAPVARGAIKRVGGLGTQLRELQAVVAHKERQGLDIASCATHFNMQAQPALGAQQGGNGRHQRHPAAATKAGFVGLAVLQQFGVHPEAGIDQKQPLVDGRHLNGAGLRLQQPPRSGGRIGRDAVRAREVVERAVRNDSHRTTRRVGGLGHGVEGAVAAHRHHCGAACHGSRCGIMGHLPQVCRAADPQLALAPTHLKGRFNHPAFGINVLCARRRIDDKQQ